MELKFKKLLEPTRIGTIVIKNRVAMAPMNNLNQFSHTEGTMTQRCIEYYMERARGDVGLIITGVFKVENRIEQTTWPILTSKGLTAFAELADYVHSYGSRIFIQLSAGAGRNMDGELIDAGVEPVCASAVPSFWRPSVTCKALTTKEVEEIVEAFGSAAELVARAEIDGIEVHGHEGYLIDEFTTSLWNKRIDKYGGDLEERLRFPMEIIQKVRDILGRNFPVTYRYGIKHFIKSQWAGALGRNGYKEMGRDVEEGFEMAKLLEKAGYDALHVDAGCYESWYWAHPPTYQPDGCEVDLVADVKKAVGIPLITVSKLGIPELAERVLEEGKADMVALGRALLADPYWVKKVQEGKPEDIRPCIGCHEGCINRANMGRPLSCSVNPSCGRERLYELKQTATPKKVFIVGGGVAGMEAARVAAIRGHQVTLYEKTDKLGGHLIEASVPDFKKDIKRLLDWYTTQLRKLKLEAKLTTNVTSELVEREKPDVLIVATGSTPIVPEILGIENPIVTTCCELLTGKKRAGDRVVVIGGGLEGCETALWLAKQGKNVMVVEMMADVVTGVFKANRDMLLDLLSENKVEIIMNTRPIEITAEGLVLIDTEFRRRVINCDTVALAVGLEPERKLYDDLVGRIPELYSIGDCYEPRKIHHAIWDAYTVGSVI